MLGSAAIAMWWDIPADVRADWEEWHSTEHMDERLGIAGFLRGTRWVGAADAGTYFVLYETADLGVVTGPAYLERLNHPTPWSRRMMPHHRNMVRSLCRVQDSYGSALAHAMATVRFSGALPPLPRARGISAAALLESQPAQGKPTAEQMMRGGIDPSADRVVLIGGYDAEAVRRAADSLGIPGSTIGLYRLSYSLSRP
jgi:hypothetical protein